MFKKFVLKNNKVRYEYEKIQSYQTGIMLQGSKLRSIKDRAMQKNMRKNNLKIKIG